MKNLVTVILIVWALDGAAQNFQKIFRVTTPATLSHSKVQWVDADNDSLLDIMIINTVQNEVTVTFLKNQSHNSFSVVPNLSTGFQTAIVTLTDFDNDNKIDIVVSGKKLTGTDATEVFTNKGNFVFARGSTPLTNQSYSTIALADLNNDGSKDLVAGDANKLSVYRRQGDQFTLQKDTAISVSAIHLFDFDNNGFHDIAFSGVDVNSDATTGVLFLKDKFVISGKTRVKRITGNIESGDLNHDGFFDLIVAGADSLGNNVIQTLQNQVNSFHPTKRLTNLDSVDVRIADVTSDGKADVAYFSKSSSTVKSWIKTFTGDSVVLPTANVFAQNYGDYDSDGDLDLVQLRGDSIVVFVNSLTEHNVGPSIVTNSFAVQLYNRMFFYWPRSIDDHTDSTALTYDLAVFNGSPEAVSAEFDQTNLHRLLASHGNVGTANYSIQKLQGGYQYQVQSIDNSFTVRTKLLGGGSCSACVDVASDPVTLCAPNAKVQLKPHAPKAMWFSFTKGYLGIHDSLTYAKSESDTIFSFNPSSSPSCSSIKLFPIISSNADTVRIAKNIWNCENSANVLSVSSEWTDVNWKNNSNATTATGNPLTVTLQAPVIYNAFASNSFGCQFKETFNLKISKPDLELSGNQYQIAKGSSVQLSAGGADTYSWSPIEGLDNPSIATPIASPLVTTTYVVVAKDSLGCSASGAVLVEVMEAGFIPTLFTPNGDGKNDVLKIFGLTSASNFRFTIYNREGSVMFDTKDLSAAAQQGWPGVTNGQSQPNGTYYWKVEGDSQGDPITLNGKKSGAFLLVR